VDCQVSPWGPWSSCDADCGAGTMSRSRTVVVEPQNGGRHCPSLQQRRGCQVSNCHHHQDPAIKEMAILLPGSLSKSRKSNETDLRHNLRINYPEENLEYDPAKQYCVEFQVVKASKACKKESNYEALKEGETVCVRCESQALRKTLGYRCQGHGVTGLFTRWSAFSAPHCHGKWVRVQQHADKSCGVKSCQADSIYIFV
ncbi:PREDICTED: somatomedin-B and thrombospondin type-1 domain-containing protein-like, partial [Nicrophorus vespilloides]|uniref:Somatomedin-B and thrombospondin type-1 domain-containing protein-like n=1 Tax=Nicrophorus vespilloides TaxID=110193 RepID=A0ABM1MYZ6_NICVS